MAAVYRVKNVAMDRDVIVDQTAIAVSVNQLFVRVSIVTCSVRYLRWYVVVPTCNDGIKNGDETDVDCGGTCLPTKQCGEGSRCINPWDCITTVCISNICQGECSYKSQDKVKYRKYYASYLKQIALHLYLSMKRCALVFIAMKNRAILCHENIFLFP